MAKTATETLLAKIDQDIARLQGMRAYVEANATAESAAEPAAKRKPRGPGKKKAGLPAIDAKGGDGSFGL